jgi:hypothetical protein
MIIKKPIHFVCLFIFGLYLITVQSYQDVKLLNDDNDIDLLNQIMNEQFIEITNNRRRVRQVAGDDTTTIADGSGDTTCKNVLRFQIREKYSFVYSLAESLTYSSTSSDINETTSSTIETTGQFAISMYYLDLCNHLKRLTCTMKFPKPLMYVYQCICRL